MSWKESVLKFVKWILNYTEDKNPVEFLTQYQTKLITVETNANDYSMVLNAEQAENKIIDDLSIKIGNELRKHNLIEYIRFEDHDYKVSDVKAGDPHNLTKIRARILVVDINNPIKKKLKNK